MEVEAEMEGASIDELDAQIRSDIARKFPGLASFLKDVG